MQELAVVVAKLVERLLPIPEVHGSNPVISNCIEKTKIKKKRPRRAIIFKKNDDIM